MRKIDADLVREAEEYVFNLLDSKLSKAHLFHSKKHTRDVFSNATFIGVQSGFSDEELTVLQISALFHDVGYLVTEENHEAESSLIARQFLESHQVMESDVQRVVRAILATKVPQKPEGKVAEVLCDADLMHLTSDHYFEEMENLRLEWQATGRGSLTEYEFHLNSINFFGSHHYYSGYGKIILEPKKEIILKSIRERVDQLREEQQIRQ